MPLFASYTVFTATGGDGATGSNSSNSNGLGLFFDTWVPVSSILTVSIVVGFTLPRHEYFGLFWLVWWALAVCVSLWSVDYEVATDGTRDLGGLFSSSEDRMRGMLVLVGLPVSLLLVLLAWWKTETPTPTRQRGSQQQRQQKQQQQRRAGIRPIRGFVLERVPLWSMVAIHVYRLDGLSIVAPFWNGKIPKFVGYQTIVLDVIMGLTAIPLTFLLYVPRRQNGSKRAKTHIRRFPFLRDALWFWNSLGLYDLCSAYVVLVLNIWGVGGPSIAEPPLLTTLGKHPLPLLLLFQVPLAIAVHVLMLIHTEELLTAQQRHLQKSHDLSLALPTTTATPANRW
mmetsp:Transcript_15034/g.41824  ORF Transcript_15034/g.41824 Transcript_15034/m.41824 type:complete len:340 (-) Transcript_15034:2837-3856(-)